MALPDMFHFHFQDTQRIIIAQGRMSPYIIFLVEFSKNEVLDTSCINLPLYYMQLKAKDIAREPIKLGPHRTVYDVRNVMVKYNIGRVIIVDNHNKALGITTEKDIARFLYQEVPNRHLNEIRLDKVMSKNLITVREEQDVISCAKIMLQNNISSIIVVNNQKNDDGYLKGIFTKTDLVESYARQYIGKNSVAKYMTKRVFTVAPDDTIHAALTLMINNKVSRIVIVTKNNKPVGIITGHDLLPISASFGTGRNRSYWTIQEKSIGKRKREHIFIPSGIKEMFLTRDVMTYDPIVITKDSDLAEAALIMMRNRISGIPVIDLDNGLAGIVTKTDIIRALAASCNSSN
jgi:CBS domain-containing protein